ncbi:MAG TPA: AraC family transcriptional regulator [Anaerolineaceae bacterium]|nr:AraC family transcriptional regulator [Anaerolineaceae bacterium]
MSSAPEPITVSISVLNQMFLYLRSLQVDIDGFLRSIGVDPEQVKAPDTRLPIETYLHIQDSAAEYVNDPFFGLHYGEYFEPGSWSILGYLMMNCRTLGEAFEKSGRYQRIIGNLIEARAELGFKKVKAVFFTPPHAPKMSRHCFEATFSSSVRMMRNLTGRSLNPLQVTFIYPQPESTAEYERVFCCPVLFGQKENSLTVDWAIGNIPVLMANPTLLAYFEKYAQDFLAELDRPKEHTRAVTKIILSRLDDEKLSIEKVSKEMAVSVRTLQKRLEDEGVIFSDLHRDIRERLAKQYLRENYTVEQITYLLGFSEPSVFRKAFKKWSGATPKEYREAAFSALNSP